MGTLINAAAIVLATLLGVLFKRGLSDNIQKGIMFVLGLGLFAISLGWFLTDFLVIEDGSISTQGDLLIIIALVVGIIIGEWIDIDRRLSEGAYGIERKYNLPPLAKGFIAGTLIFCVGAMAIVGSLQDGISGDSTTLIIKSALDFVTALVLASFLGVGVALSAVSVLIYQGGITLLARAVAPVLTPDILASLSMVGNIILMAIGINFMELKKIKVANMLPALLIPIIYYLVLALFNR